MNSFNYILFGATGDLAKSKIFPAIIDLFDKKLLPEDFILIATGRSQYSDEDFREYLISKFSKDKQVLCKKFCRNIYYVSGDVLNSKLYQDIYKKLEKINSECKTNIYHFAILPTLYLQAVEKLGESILNRKDSRNSKILIEKPFGMNKRSAKDLDNLLYKYFEQNQIFRLDHYLGKETVSNILALRFANGLFEPIWNHHFIDHIQIQLLENNNVKDRGEFYDATGALRDVVQNHILQLLGLILMDRPSNFTQDRIRARKQEIIYSIQKIKPENIITGQYENYQKNLGKISTTETFTALKLTIDKNRWQGMPIYIRTGKALQRKVTEIAVVFKKPPFKLFSNIKKSASFKNILHIRIEPNEGIVLDLNLKKPGIKMDLEAQSLQYCYKDKTLIIEPYTKLLFDALKGDQTSFNLRQEVLASWKFIDPILELLQKNKTKPNVYTRDSWGPKEAFDLIEKDNRNWFEPDESFCRI